jgi:uncharacterized membrane protein
MTHEKQIKEWLKSGVISEEQAKKMRVDIHQNSSEERSNKFIVAISLIGAVLLGVGAILFVSSNWEELSNFMKIFILLGSTFTSYYLGYLFKYDKKNLPKVGASLLFLGALLFGASVFLIAQMYHINANAHSLVLIWLIGILPLVYAFLSEPITLLSSFLFFLWIGLFVFRNNVSQDNLVFLLPILYLCAGMFFYSLGGLHSLYSKFLKIARIFRTTGIEIMMISLFLLTFKVFSGDISEYWFRSIRGIVSMESQIRAGIVLFALLALIGLVSNLFFNPSKSKMNSQEQGIFLGILGITLLFFFFPAESNIYNVIYNLLFFGVSVFLIFIGYQRSDIQFVNIGTLWLVIFLFAKYFDFFWDLMERSLFFIVGGIILVLGGIALEQKRRKIKESFQNVNT